jgi:GT2 family glycosyltransferase
VIVNPDAELTSAHWIKLCEGAPDEVRTLPINDDNSQPTSVVNEYPTAFGHLLSGFRVGRYLNRGSRIRSWLSRHSGTYARGNDESLGLRSGRWRLNERWASGAILSIDSDRLRSIDGFDPHFFLYCEDVDLCGRLAARYPTMDLVLLHEAPARHSVGGSAEPGGAVEKHRLASAITYASRQPGMPWRITTTLLRLRQRWA